MAIALVDYYSKEELEQIVQHSYSLKEVINKLGYTTYSGRNGNTVKKRIQKYNIDCSHFAYKKGTKRSEENIFIKDSTATQAVLRRWYLKGEYTRYECSICGLKPVWNDKPLTLILDHINGNNHDDRLENLRWVCPNCNQQLDTTNGKGKHNKLKSIKKRYYCKQCGKEISKSSKSQLCPTCWHMHRRIYARPSREELKRLIRTTSFTAIAKQYNITSNGVKKWCDAESLPRKSSEIKKYSEKEWELI